MKTGFAYKKTTQALNVLARKAGGQISKLLALKLVFFADRYHLRKYGRPLTNDSYLAMKYGPVASGAKNLAEGNRSFLSSEERNYSGRYIRPVDKNLYESVGEPDMDVFSDTDMEALEFAWARFGGVGRFELARATHEYPEWKRHAAALECNASTREAMCWLDFLEDPPTPLDPCHALDERQRAIRREELLETAALRERWG
jgi:uncharacterized phage-associated protein